MSAVRIPTKAHVPRCESFEECPTCYFSGGSPTLDLEALLCYAYESLQVWGDDKQRTMAMGEAAEFIDALAKHARGRATPAQVVDEAADAIIVAAVAVALAGGDSPALAERIRFKMDRARAKMASAKGGGEQRGD